MQTSANPDGPQDRRPIASREWPVMRRIAAGMTRAGVSPDFISIASIGFALVAGLALAATPQAECPVGRVALWLIAAAGILLRLLANMFDGMVAVERGTASPLGELYNEVPDRLSDALILIGAGLATGGSIALGLLAALSAVFVAYVRAAGAAAGAPQAFMGPMAKQQRMFLIILTCLLCAATPPAWHAAILPCGIGLPSVALAIIIAGCLVTAARRLGFIARALRGKP